MVVCVYLFKCLLPYNSVGGIVWLCVYISLNACYLITVLSYYYWWYSIDVCVLYLFKCLLPLVITVLPYYRITLLPLAV